MNSITKTFGFRLKHLRKKAGLSQEQLALTAELAPSFVGEVERNLKRPSLETIEKLENALEISVPELLSYDPETYETSTAYIQKEIMVQLESCTPDEAAQLSRILKYIIEFRNMKDKKPLQSYNERNKNK